MAQFLTDAWLEALTEGLGAHDGFTGAIANTDLVLQFDVTDPPEGLLDQYFLEIANGTARAGAGPATDPEVSISSTYDTAVAISKGDLNTQMAFMTGKIKVSGNMGKLMMNQAMLSEFAKAAATVDITY